VSGTDGEMDDAARPRFAEISTAFPTVPESVAAARRFVAASLRRFDFSEGAVEQAVLATSELVANAFGEGRPPIRIRVRSIADGRAAIEVHHGVDDDPTDPDTVAAGLQLTAAGRTVVDSMATRWGSRPTGSGVVAWFEIDDPARTGAGVAGSA
jgi:anti-sigma regulatory factor (Ser/Thr protein kinase)